MNQNKNSIFKRLLLIPLTSLILISQVTFSKENGRNSIETHADFKESASDDSQMLPSGLYTVKLHLSNRMTGDTKSSEGTVYATFEQDRYVVVCQPVGKQYLDARIRCNSLRSDANLGGALKIAEMRGTSKDFSASEFRDQNKIWQFLSHYLFRRYSVDISSLLPGDSSKEGKIKKSFKKNQKDENDTGPEENRNSQVVAEDNSWSSYQSSDVQNPLSAVDTKRGVSESSTRDRLKKAGTGLIGIYGASHLLHGISNFALVPLKPDKTVNWMGRVVNEDHEFFSLSEDGYTIHGWSSAPELEKEKAVLFLPGNAWGFDGAIDFADRLQYVLDGDFKSVRVYTVAYVGQGSHAPGFYRNEKRQVTVINKVLNKIKTDGFANNDISIFAHSIGGFLSGLALKNDEFDGIGALAVASPASLGRVASQLAGLFLGASTVIDYAGWWFGNAIDGYSKKGAGPRMAIYATDDTLVYYRASIASGLDPQNRGKIIGNHINCFRLHNTIYSDSNKRMGTVKEKLYSIIERK